MAEKIKELTIAETAGYLEAMAKRRSRRTYNTTPVASWKLEKIAGLIERFNQEADLTMRLIEDGSDAFNRLNKSYGLFSGVRTIIALSGYKADKNLKEKIGYYGEFLMLEATNMELGSCWVGGSFYPGSKIFALPDDEELVCVITLGDVVDQSFKERLIHKLATLKAKYIKDLWISTEPIPEWAMSGLEAVLLAPSANNRKPVKFAYQAGILSAFVDNNNKFELIDLGIAKAHFELATGGRFANGNHGEFKKQDA